MASHEPQPESVPLLLVIGSVLACGSNWSLAEQAYSTALERSSATTFGQAAVLCVAVHEQLGVEKEELISQLLEYAETAHSRQQFGAEGICLTKALKLAQTAPVSSRMSQLRRSWRSWRRTVRSHTAEAVEAVATSLSMESLVHYVPPPPQADTTSAEAAFRQTGRAHDIHIGASHRISPQWLQRQHLLGTEGGTQTGAPIGRGLEQMVAASNEEDDDDAGDADEALVDVDHLSSFVLRLYSSVM